MGVLKERLTKKERNVIVANLPLSNHPQLVYHLDTYTKHLNDSVGPELRLSSVLRIFDFSS